MKEADKDGTIDVAAAQSLGLPPGPAYAHLKKGGSVTLPDGTVIHSSDVSLHIVVRAGPCRRGW